MKKLLKEFKEFAYKGNAIDLAIGVIIGSAFAGITASIVSDLFLPLIGLFIGGIDLSSWVINIPNFIYQGDPIAIKVGSFLMTVINFLIIAFVVFLMVKAMNAVKKLKAQEQKIEKLVEPIPTKEEVLLTEIRDILAKSNK